MSASSSILTSFALSLAPEHALALGREHGPSEDQSFLRQGEGLIRIFMDEESTSQIDDLEQITLGVTVIVMRVGSNTAICEYVPGDLKDRTVDNVATE